MDKQNIVVTYNATSEEKALFFEVLGSEASLTFLNEIPVAQREQSLENATVLLSWNFPREIQPQEYPRLQHVTLIQLVTAGADHMPFADLPSPITVASNPGAYAIPMAEHVMAMTLALAKRLFIEHQKLINGEFDDTTLNRSLFGMTAGIIGFGGTGRATARLMRAFGMNIYAINQSGKSTEPTEFISTLHDLEHVLRACDVVVISLPLTRVTRGLIGKKELAWMKPDAILVNVARGAITDEEALYTHLKDHPTFMAGIDTWWIEPLRGGTFRMDYPFLNLPNVLGSPHNSALVSRVIGDAAQQAAENIKHFLKGKKVIGIVPRVDYLW
ncbi:MAG TPA: 2-hydroxyacid dehydrogenase [Ktedonobacteraceae bacterium]|jgi:glycerate dehydrogenase|nr:2-hydroxyacid dehydrogenase [Ktedonobacteraceae bacterium]